MFTAMVFDHATDLELGVGTGETVTAAITAAGKDAVAIWKSVTGTNGYPRAIDRIGVRVYETSTSIHAVNGKVVIFTAYEYGIYAALRAAHAMNSKSRKGNGR